MLSIRDRSEVLCLLSQLSICLDTNNNHVNVVYMHTILKIVCYYICSSKNNNATEMNNSSERAIHGFVQVFHKFA